MTALPLHRRGFLAPLARVAGGDKLVTAALAVLTVLTVAAVLAPLIAPHDPDAVDLSATLSGSTPDHLLGADQSGRDVLSRLIFGARTGLLGPLVVVLVSTVLGTLIGVSAAWHGGAVDAVLSRAMELVFSFPALLLAIILVAVLGPGPTAPVIAMSVAYAPYVGRLARSVALREKGRPYIQAYQVQGWSGWMICVGHLLPNIAPLVLAQSAINFGYALMDLAALSFLGLGVQPPAADWGAMINDGSQALLQGAMLPALAPGAAIVITVVAFSTVGESIADRVARRER
ncbi:ABC transporter permease subunit [Nonomuraea roseoviolacea subsp. roseoviolacea]|uniref:Peptide/nickel transport system permease protein n=1 Tax=Nonomuraea roseoviolacea subsp. carminata TaxID=160689 RepID=A0ABT1KAT4_9ACTN|nr:ABC transporter permease [Nonomuraea roseoviolacea]MCP2351137.1 peptide/nickel transport system permease protein [Nonomuraea roseoviolacea subsp. carminata]